MIKYFHPHVYFGEPVPLDIGFLRRLDDEA